MRFDRRQATLSARLAARLALLATVLGSGWALAPAISAETYVPGAKDFEQVLPALERMVSPSARAVGSRHADHPGEGAVTHVSPVIEAPARFDLAGVGGEMRPLELRGRESGGEWTDWTETAAGDPVWFGGMDELQLRARGWRPSGTLHYVNVSGDATPAEEALTNARQSVNGFVTAGIGIFGADDAAAGSTMPHVVTRKQWGAERGQGGCQPRGPAEYGTVKAAAIHHTVNAVDYSEAEAPGIVLGICRFHRDGNGWNDIGYNSLVDRFGNIYAGRDGGLGRAVVGAQAEGYNAQTTGVAVVGTHSSVPISKRALGALARWLAWKLPQHGLTAGGTAKLISAGGQSNRYPAGTKVKTARIISHRSIGFTACPGDTLAGQLSKLTRKVQGRIGGGGSGGGGGGGGCGGGGGGGGGGIG